MVQASARPLVLGLDGGNTKTLAIVAGLDGMVVGTGRSGGSDIHGVPLETALGELTAAIDGALSEAGGSRDDVVAAGCSLAGADWPEDYTLLEDEMRQRLARATQVIVHNDAMGALRAGTKDGEGVAVVCGTGSAIGARSGAKSWSVSYWGEDGGAQTMGKAGLRAMVRADLGLDPPVGFSAHALEVFEAASVGELLHRATRRGTPRNMLAALAPTVLDAADHGDPVARRIVLDMGRVLGEYARVAAGRVGLGADPFPLVLAGGVFLHESPLIRGAIAAALPHARIVESEYEPVVGALLLAFDELEGHTDLEMLRGSLPHADHFRTTATRARTRFATPLT